MMREEAGIVRDHFIWFEKQIEKWRISWAMFALSATTMKESDRKDCMERLKEEESRLADAYFVSRIASTKTEDEALGECPSSRYVTTSASVSDRASTIKSFPLNSRSNTASSTKARSSHASGTRSLDRLIPAPILTDRSESSPASGVRPANRVNFV
mmetsp:Transcript_70466/g.188979  ORF Transcript_70466/g.188979 Transcript_70466/m.188979 type:complete len:156 (-) Transcript_70466:151-618(-)